MIVFFCVFLNLINILTNLNVLPFFASPFFFEYLVTNKVIILFSALLFVVLQGHVYKPSNVEILCQTVITLASSIMLVTFYSFPMIVVYFYNRYGLTLPPTCAAHLTLWFTGAGAVLGFCFVIRGLERWTNQDYYDFSKHIQNSLSLIWLPIQTKEKLLSRYDFEFSYWPADFKMPKDDQNMKKQSTYKLKPNKPNMISKIIYEVILKVYRYICLKRANYNQKAVFNGRTNLIENANYNGQRFKLLTIDNNQIDCVFIDRRNNLSNSNGDTLVICCEGIAGHYECGISCTPLRAGPYLIFNRLIYGIDLNNFSFRLFGVGLESSRFW